MADPHNPASSPGDDDLSLDFSLDRAALFWHQNRSAILWVMAIVAVIGIAVGLWFVITQAREGAAKRALSEAQTDSQWEQVIRSFDGSIAAGDAALLLANSQRAAGKLDAANVTLQQFIQAEPKHPLIGLAQLALAENQALAGKIVDAEQALQELANARPNDFVAQLALFRRAQLQIAAFQRKDALQTLKQLQLQYPSSAAAQLAAPQISALQSSN